MAIQWDRISHRLGLYRDTENGWVAGVCAGIAGRLHIRPVWIRGLFILASLIPNSFVGVLFYFALAFLMQPRAGAAAAASPAGVQMAYRDLTASFSPNSGRQVSDLKSRFASLDSRLNNLEAAALSDELSLRRKFRDIGG
jgi:phage shock protein C